MVCGVCFLRSEPIEVCPYSYKVYGCCDNSDKCWGKLHVEFVRGCVFLCSNCKDGGLPTKKIGVLEKDQEYVTEFESFVATKFGFDRYDEVKRMFKNRHISNVDSSLFAQKIRTYQDGRLGISTYFPKSNTVDKSKDRMLTQSYDPSSGDEEPAEEYDEGDDYVEEETPEPKKKPKLVKWISDDDKFDEEEDEEEDEDEEDDEEGEEEGEDEEDAEEEEEEEEAVEEEKEANEGVCEKSKEAVQDVVADLLNAAKQIATADSVGTDAVLYHGVDDANNITVNDGVDPSSISGYTFPLLRLVSEGITRSKSLKNMTDEEVEALRAKHNATFEAYEAKKAKEGKVETQLDKDIEKEQDAFFKYVDAQEAKEGKDENQKEK